MLEKIVGAHIGLVGELLVVDCFQIGVEGIGDVRALHAEQQLALFHVVVKARFDVDHAAIGKRDDRNFAGDVGKDGPGSVQFSGSFDLTGGDDRELWESVGSMVIRFIFETSITWAGGGAPSPSSFALQPETHMRARRLRPTPW